MSELKIHNKEGKRVTDMEPGDIEKMKDAHRRGGKCFFKEMPQFMYKPVEVPAWIPDFIYKVEEVVKKPRATYFECRDRFEQEFKGKKILRQQATEGVEFFPVEFSEWVGRETFKDTENRRWDVNFETQWDGDPYVDRWIVAPEQVSTGTLTDDQRRFEEAFAGKKIRWYSWGPSRTPVEFDHWTSGNTFEDKDGGDWTVNWRKQWDPDAQCGMWVMDHGQLTLCAADSKVSSELLGTDTVIETPGVRQNTGKPMLSVIDPKLLLEMGKGLAIGQERYKDKAFNVPGNVMKLTTGYDSALRHLLKFMAGEDVDAEDGIHHIAKAMNCLVIMWHNREIGDDRRET